MFEFIKRTISKTIDAVLSIPGHLFSYNGILYGSAITCVVVVASLGFTTATMSLCLLLPVAAGVYNAYFNADEV